MHQAQAIYQASLQARPAEPFLRDAADRVFIPYILGIEIPDTARGDLTQALANVIANPSVLALHSFGMGIRALNMCGLPVPADFRLPEHAWSAQRCVSFLQQRDWSQPWGQSILILHLLMLQLTKAAINREQIFQTLEQFQAANGGWGTASFHQQMAAAFHFIPLYRLCNRVMPRLERLCQQILIEEPQGVGFGAMDALYILHYAVELGVLSVKQINIDAYEGILARALVGDRHEYVAAAQTAALLDACSAGTVLRDAWAPNLWSCD